MSASDDLTRARRRPANHPTLPVRQYSFTDHSIHQSTTPQPGNHLDREHDRSNDAIKEIVTWTGVSLNTDGTLRPATVSFQQIAPGVFDHIADAAIAQVQPIVDQVLMHGANMDQATVHAARSASSAQRAADTASGRSIDAQDAASDAASSANDALLSANAAAASATDADNDANSTAGDVAICTDYGVLTQAWAEHMPDPIPPNILAVMGVTGDHWSSRWWANKAANAFGSLSELYLGVHPTPPLTTSTGDPIPLGAIYYNSITHQVYVWDGTQWQEFWAPTKAYTLSLAYLLAAGQTQIVLTTPDLGGNHYTLSTLEPEPLELYLNGVRLSPANIPSPDWTVNLATSTITLAKPALAGTLAVIDILAPANTLAPSRTTTKLLLDFDVDPTTGNPGLIDGARKNFTLALASDHSVVSVLSPMELQVILDGAIQKPGTDYTTATTQITFVDAPIPGEAAWAIWFGG